MATAAVCPDRHLVSGSKIFESGCVLFGGELSLRIGCLTSSVVKSAHSFLLAVDVYLPYVGNEKVFCGV